MRIKSLMIALAACALACVVCLPTMADEGMWTYDHFPATQVKKVYGADVTAAWLDHVRLSTVRLANCTASFVSPDGLMLTNNHCVQSCLAELSSKDHNLIGLGFAAADRGAERRCSTQVADVLLESSDVTATVAKALAGMSDKAANDARKKVLTSLEQNCEKASLKSRSGPLKCQAVTLYGGGQYFIYKYKRYDDVRIVFAPEADIAAFGGDPDNFQFPRWSLDFSMLRAYEHGKPASTPQHLKIDFAGPQPGQLVFVSGHPGSTERQESKAQLEFQRDLSLTPWLLRASELRGRYIQFGVSKTGNDELVTAPLNALENGIKVRRKLLDTLHENSFMQAKAADETALRSKADFTHPDPWDDIDRATARERELFMPYTFIESGAGFNTLLFRYARFLVRAADERAKPNTERLREYSDAFLPRLEQQVIARIPVYAAVEEMTLAASLSRMREWLGPDHPLVRRLLAKDSPESLATRLVAESKLDDAAVRKRLWDGGKTAIDASLDPMIALARSIDPEARTIRARFEDEVEAPLSVASEKIAAARFKTYGTDVYPDATFTLRLNYGQVAGWTEGGSEVAPFTYLDRAFERATGASPFKIPESWLKARNRLDLHTPFCISTNNDIVGGNSGSPLIDIQGDIVGLMFDGNIHSISGAFWFDTGKNRAVALHPAIIKEALSKVYSAGALLKEMGGA